MEFIIGHLEELWKQAVTIWIAGGWAMIPIAFVGMVMYGLGTHLYLKFREKGFLSLPEETWRHWINHPCERKGPIGAMLDFVTGGSSIKDLSVFFDELRTTELSPFTRDLRIMKICVGVAPLLGLLGTVTGMLTTFNALASGSGGEKTMGLVAAGISEALITTETGLVIALPGLFMQYMLDRKYQRYKTFLAHVETVCTQKHYKKMQETGKAV